MDDVGYEFDDPMTDENLDNLGARLCVPICCTTHQEPA